MKTSFVRSVFVIAFMLLSALLFADVPNEIVYQGKLKEYGQLVTATRNIQFKIFDTQTGGTQIGTTYGGNMPVTNGQFSYVLNLSGVDWYQGNYWIETVVENKILSPREKLTASAYALHSRTSEGIQKKSGTTIDFNIGTEKKASIATDGTMSCLVGGTSYYMVPRGAIIMWSGTIASIPSGWALCNGANGTPNLSDRFILSVANASENPGAIGGSNLIYLSVAQLPSHSHTASCSTNGSHSHTAKMAYGGGEGTYSVHNSAASSTFLGWLSGAKIDDAGDHSHTITIDSSGSGNAVDIHPNYYKLAFIMKL
jgi:microcystin-dependent protein